MKNSTCSLCGKDLKTVYTLNGKIYGSECIKKVSGQTVKENGLQKQYAYETVKTEINEKTGRTDILIKTENDFKWVVSYLNPNNINEVQRVINGFYISPVKIK